MLLQVANFNPVVGSLVWVEDSDVAWIDGEVVEVNGQDIKVLCTSGKTVSKLTELFHYFTTQPAAEFHFPP